MQYIYIYYSLKTINFLLCICMQLPNMKKNWNTTVVEAENAPAALTTESYARVSIAFPKILCRHCHIWPMHAKQVNPCRPVALCFSMMHASISFHKPAVDWSTSPMLRFPQVRFLMLMDFPQVRFCNSNHPFRALPPLKSISMATDRQPLPQAFPQKPPDIRDTTGSIAQVENNASQTTKISWNTWPKNKQPGKQTPKLKELVSFFPYFYHYWSQSTTGQAVFPWNAVFADPQRCWQCLTSDGTSFDLIFM